MSDMLRLVTKKSQQFITKLRPLQSGYTSPKAALEKMHSLPRQYN